MGYTFIPTNRAQVMMIIIGNGGEGKSRIALILRALHGDNMNLYSIQKLATDKFARADQVGKLLMLWCLEGLHRLIKQDFEFTVSDRMRRNLEEMKKNDNNIFDFYAREGSAQSKNLFLIILILLISAYLPKPWN